MNYNNKNNNKLYGLWTQVLVINDTIIYYKIEIYHNIYCGFTAEKNKNFNISNLPECEEIRHIIKEIDGEEYKTSKHVLNFNVTGKMKMLLPKENINRLFKEE